jgi:hypothetical protein
VKSSLWVRTISSALGKAPAVSTAALMEPGAVSSGALDDVTTYTLPDDPYRVILRSGGPRAGLITPRAGRSRGRRCRREARTTAPDSRRERRAGVIDGPSQGARRRSVHSCWLSHDRAVPKHYCLESVNICLCA